MKNIHYKSRQICSFYSNERQAWKDFYPSEKWVFERICSSGRGMGHILDVGCACGGLAKALNQKFRISSYTGVDVNCGSIEWAKDNIRLPFSTDFIEEDIVKTKINRKFDTVISLGCADWNIETRKIVRHAWERVSCGGYLVISLRITPKKGINDMKKSFQYINFNKKEKDPEIANYVVLNFEEALKMFDSLSFCPESIGAYGYWGKPSSMAVTPFKKVIFSVFYLKKGGKNTKTVRTEFFLPADLYLWNSNTRP